MKFLLLLFPAWLAAQPQIGRIEVFGARKANSERIQKALGVKPGDRLPNSKGDVEARLEDVPNVVRAHLEGFCCEQGKAILYVGIEEPGGRYFELRPSPEQEIALPEEISALYAQFAEALSHASREGNVAEDLSRGHSLMVDEECRKLQVRMVGLAETHEGELREVLRGAADAGQRAIAAYVIGYSPDKGRVMNDLQYGLQDADEGVRRNSARALKAIAYFGTLHPELKMRVEPTWFVEMLNSISLSDRMEGVNALLFLTDKGNDAVVRGIRERALDALYEMASWQYLPHALPAYLLLGRVTGKSDEEMQAAWSRGEREKMVESLRKPKK